MGGITFLDYVKELPKGKREAKGATKGGYASTTKKPAAPSSTAAAPAPAAATPAPGVASANGSGSTARGLPEASEAGAGGGGGGSEADLIGEKIAAKVSRSFFVSLYFVCFSTCYRCRSLDGLNSVVEAQLCKMRGALYVAFFAYYFVFIFFVLRFGWIRFALFRSDLILANVLGRVCAAEAKPDETGRGCCVTVGRVRTTSGAYRSIDDMVDSYGVRYEEE